MGSLRDQTEKIIAVEPGLTPPPPAVRRAPALGVFGYGSLKGVLQGY